MRITFSKITKFFVAFVTVMLLLLFWGAAAAQVDSKYPDLVKFGGDVTIVENQVVGDATAIGGSVTVLNGGQVTGDAVAVGGDVILRTGARVDGDVTAVGGRVLPETGVSVGGETNIVFGENGGIFQNMRNWGWSGLLVRLYLVSVIAHVLVMVAIALVGILLVLLIPHFLQTIASTINQSPLTSAAWGLGGTLALIVLSALIGGSLLGVIVLPVVNLAALVVTLLGTISMGLLIGKITLKASQTPPVTQLLMGMLILGLIGLIPVVGGIFFLTVHIFGFGGVLASQLEQKRLSRFGHTRLHPQTLKPVDEHRHQIS